MKADMGSRRRVAAVIVASLALVVGITACIPEGTPEECAGTTTTTVLVDCAWTTSTTEPTTTVDPSTTVAPTTTTRPPGNVNDPWWAYKGNLAGPKVVVAGDSITSLSKNAINAALYPDYATQVMGLSGHKLAQADYYLEPYPATNPDVVIIEFGTNDGNGILADSTGQKRAEWKAKYLDIASRFPNACFVPVTMPASRNYPTWDASQQELNDWLLATFPDTADWNRFELGQRAAGYNLLGADFIHPEGLGFSSLAAVYLGAVERCLT